MRSCAHLKNKKHEHYFLWPLENDVPNVLSKRIWPFKFVSRKWFVLPMISATNVINTIDCYNMHMHPEIIYWKNRFSIKNRPYNWVKDTHFLEEIPMGIQNKQTNTRHTPTQPKQSGFPWRWVSKDLLTQSSTQSSKNWCITSSHASPPKTLRAFANGVVCNFPEQIVCVRSFFCLDKITVQ